MSDKIISKKVQKDLIHFWGKVGLIVQLSQMVEYNLSNILSADEVLREFEDNDSMFLFEYNELARKANEWYDKLNMRPLGTVLKRAEEIKYFTKDFFVKLKDICERRNYVVHKLFKEDLTKKHLENNPRFYFEYLEKLIEDMNEINIDLVAFLQKQKQELKLIY